MDLDKSIKKARTIGELFSLVKGVVREFVKRDQAGLLVGLSDLGMREEGFVGAYYSLSSNMIVLNKTVMSQLLKTRPDLYNYYAFHLLLHEYVHSIGLYDEDATRMLVHEITLHYFGEDHVLADFARGLENLIPHIRYAAIDHEPGDFDIEFVPGIDRSNTNYIM